MKRRNMLAQDVFDIFATHASLSLVYVVVDHFHIALFSALKQTHYTLVACDSK